MEALLIQYSVEMLTATTLTLIGAILIVDLLIFLKNNDWIGKTSSYRCPNPQCQKIFQKPLKVKNFSNKKETRFACPECGCDLGSSSVHRSLDDIIVGNKPDLRIKGSASSMPKTKASKTSNGNREPKEPKTDSSISESKENKISQETSNKIILKQKKGVAKENAPNGCSLHFGYLAALPKGTKTPDECYSCTRLIECYRQAPNLTTLEEMLTTS